MKRFLSFLFLTFVFIQLSVAQESPKNVSSSSMCSHLMVSGRVQLMQDVRLTELLGTNPKSYYAGEKNKAQKGTKAMGYRIRVFSGSKQNASKNRAYGIRAEITNKLPDIQTKVVFNTPNWRLLVGGYRTIEEAKIALKELQDLFPAYSREMFLVKDMVQF